MTDQGQRYSVQYWQNDYRSNYNTLHTCGIEHIYRENIYVLFACGLGLNRVLLSYMIQFLLSARSNCVERPNIGPWTKTHRHTHKRFEHWQSFCLSRHQRNGVFNIIYVIPFFTYYQSSGLFDQRPIHAVHFVVQAAGIAQVMAGAVAPPQGRRNGTAIHTLAALREHVRVDQLRQTGGHGARTCIVCG